MPRGSCGTARDTCSRCARTVRGRSHVYNSVPLDLVPALREVLDTGVAAVRLDLQMLTPPQAAAQVARTSRALAAVASGIDAPTSRAAGAPTTTGHFFRGLL